MYSILQSINKGVNKPTKYSLNFFMGTLFYVVLHWLIFSSLVDKYPVVKKLRLSIYAIFAVDFYFYLYLRNKQRIPNSINLENYIKNYSQNHPPHHSEYYMQ